MNFRDYLAKNVAPPWLQQPNGLAWNRAAGDVMDSLEDRIRQAVKARFPRHAPPDALAIIGAERKIERGLAETAAHYAERVVKAWEAWTWGGTPFGMLTALWHLGYTTPKLVIVRGKAHSLDASGELVVENLPAGSWAIDATPRFWSKFQLLFPYPHPWVGSGIPAADSETVEQLRRIVRRWKPAHATCAGIVVHTGGWLWGSPVGTWGARAPWGGGSATVWTV